jgi:tetratricopeptide (TPR) repeat protein
MTRQGNALACGLRSNMQDIVKLAAPAFALAIFLVPQQPAIAQFQDEIDIRGPRAIAHYSLKCRINDYNGKFVRVISTGGEQTYPISEIAGVRYAKQQQQIDAEQLLAAAKNDEAESLLKKAVDAEPRRWVRREILALLTGCALRREDYATAGTRFRQIAESDPHTRHINLAPLIWSDQSVDGLNRSTAAAWLSDAESLNRLLGASLLLYDPEYGHRARDTIRELNRLPDERIRLMAQWQERRLQISSRRISEFDVANWASTIERLEPPLRAGPLFLLGEARLIRQEYDLAAAEFLKLPIVYSSDHPVIARASFEAGRALLRNGLQVEAARQFQETTSRYPWSTAARDAQASLKQLLASVTHPERNSTRSRD